MQSLSKEQTIAQIGIIEKRQLRGPTCTIALKKTHFHKKVVSAPQCTMKHREIGVGLFEYFFKSKNAQARAKTLLARDLVPPRVNPRSCFLAENAWPRNEIFSSVS